MTRPPAPPVTGVLLAAGAGRRAGGPKALRRDADGTAWLTRAVRVLAEGGCARVVVVLGARAAEARAVLGSAVPLLVAPAGPVTVVENEAWADGLAGSLGLGLRTAFDGGALAALVLPVDLPDVGPAVVARVLRSAAPTPTVLARATYAGRPGHPVLVGRDHGDLLLASLAGDRGGQRYLQRAGACPVECGTLASGLDVDGPPAAGVGGARSPAGA